MILGIIRAALVGLVTGLGLSMATHAPSVTMGCRSGNVGLAVRGGAGGRVSY